MQKQNIDRIPQDGLIVVRGTKFAALRDQSPIEGRYSVIYETGGMDNTVRPSEIDRPTDAAEAQFNLAIEDGIGDGLSYKAALMNAQRMVTLEHRYSRERADRGMMVTGSDEAKVVSGESDLGKLLIGAVFSEDEVAEFLTGEANRTLGEETLTRTKAGNLVFSPEEIIEAGKRSEEQERAADRDAFYQRELQVQREHDAAMAKAEEELAHEADPSSTAIVGVVEHKGDRNGMAYDLPVTLAPELQADAEELERRADRAEEARERKIRGERADYIATLCRDRKLPFGVIEQAEENDSPAEHPYKVEETHGDGGRNIVARSCNRFSAVEYAINKARGTDRVFCVRGGGMDPVLVLEREDGETVAIPVRGEPISLPGTEQEKSDA